MKIAFLLTFVLFSATPVARQMFSSAVQITTTYSQNGKYFLKSIPFDNEEPSLRGRSYVYENGNPTPLYQLDRAFDGVSKNNNHLILSNDGEVIFYVVTWGADEQKDGLNSINIYRQGKFIKGYSKAEITGCDEKKERCGLLYYNFEQVVDKEKSQWGTQNYQKVFKAGVDEQERFLSDFALFSDGDTVYLTDSKKRLHAFDLKEGRLRHSEAFANLYPQIKDKGRFSQAEMQRFEAPVFLDFPTLQDGKKVAAALAPFIGMKPVNPYGKTDGRYKHYRLKLNGYLAQSGKFEIETIELDAELPQAKIIEFFQSQIFDSRALPRAFEKWHVRDHYFYFRKHDDRVARQEKRQEQLRQRQELAKRLTLESINGVYIPKDLGECFSELDKLLKEVGRKEMQALPHRDEMIQYHHGLGTWLRNNWGLWGGSRLQKYFTERGVMHPDEMSGIVLLYYHDWLQGKKDTWKEWEQKTGRK